MATILDSIVFDPCQRPAYTKYELSKKVAEKRSASELSIEEFSKRYDVSSSVVSSIEKGKQSFDVSMYKACSVILELDIDELLRTDKEDIGCVRFRAEEVSNDTLDTVRLANVIFNEMVMQRKIRAR